MKKLFTLIIAIQFFSFFNLHALEPKEKEPKCAKREVLTQLLAKKVKKNYSVCFTKSERAIFSPSCLDSSNLSLKNCELAKRIKGLEGEINRDTLQNDQGHSPGAIACEAIHGINIDIQVQSEKLGPTKYPVCILGSDEGFISHGILAAIITGGSFKDE